MRPDLVIFDLDGTLSDSAPGILHSLEVAFAALDLPPLDEATARSLLGPPFGESFPRLLGGPERVPELIAAYRADYRAGGLLNATAYDGIPELLAGLRSAGVRMAVATSKLEEFARPILEHLGLDGYFATVVGDLPDSSRGRKALVIAEVLRRLGDPDPAGAIMVGDRSHDVVGAAAHGLPCAGAGWGYGRPGELAEAGADPICATPAELAAVLGVDADVVTG